MWKYWYFSVEEVKQHNLSEILNLKRALGQEVFEKDAAQKAANDLRNMIKKSESEKLEQNHVIQELKQKISGNWTSCVHFVCIEANIGFLITVYRFGFWNSSIIFHISNYVDIRPTLTKMQYGTIWILKRMKSSERESKIGIF